MRKRVAVVYHFFPHYRSAIIRRLAEEGTCDWTFFGDAQDFDRDSGIQPMVFPPEIEFRRLKVSRLRGSVIWQHGVVRLAASRDYDTLILLGVSKYLSMWVGAIVGRLTGKRVLFWTHGWTYRPKGPLRYVRRYFYRLANGIMTYGRWAKQIALEEGFDPSTVYVIGNSLDLSTQSEALRAMDADRPAAVRMELFGNSLTPVITCISRLTAVRRLDLLLYAAARIRERGLSVNVLLIGDGPERARLELLAAELGVRVAFAGECYEERRICELMRASNVTVAPGKVGLTAMHSMAYGIPVVTHGDHENQMPEFEAVVPGKTGSLFRLGDIDDLADAIEPWLRSAYVQDSTSERCKAIVQRFWCADFQRDAIMRAVNGSPSDDLLFLRPGRNP